MPGQDSARALVSQPGLIPLVILRGSGDSLVDRFKLLSVPETGINIDAVPRPRGPVTFRDLCLRQFVVTPL